MTGAASGDRLAAWASWLLLAAAVAAGLAILARTHLAPSGGQGAPAASDAAAALALPPPHCANGVTVPDPVARPELVADCQALLLNKDALRGEGELNWSAYRPIADWDGVVLTAGGRRVEQLRLEDRGLAGRIPAALGQLTGLRALDLGGNRLGGEIPEALGELTELRELRLDGNRLTGDVPVSLAGLDAIESLRLGGNGLTGCIPAALRDRGAALGGLSVLGLPYCTCERGRAAPPDNAGLVADCLILLGAMDRLRGEAPLNWSPDLAMEDWDGIGLSEGEPRRVASVHLRNRDLTGSIPAELGGLTELNYLNVGADNSLTGSIPAELTNLTKLREFYAGGGGNSLTGAIPAGFGNLTDLRVLYLTGNRLTGGIPDLSRTRLEYLNLRGNRLTGPVPSWLGGVATLRRLNLRGNLLAGGIPPELGGLPRLEELLLGAGNALTGCVPPPLRGVAAHDLDELGLPDCASR